MLGWLRTAPLRFRELLEDYEAKQVQRLELNGSELREQASHTRVRPVTSPTQH
jgi:hypothetical protein